MLFSKYDPKYFHAWPQFPVKIREYITSCITGSFSNDGLSGLLENLNIKENIKNDTSHLDIENALENLKFQVEIQIHQCCITQIVTHSINTSGVSLQMFLFKRKVLKLLKRDFKPQVSLPTK